MKVVAPPEELKLPAFYKKYVSANGYPIVASEKVSDFALKEAALKGTVAATNRHGTTIASGHVATKGAVTCFNTAAR